MIFDNCLNVEDLKGCLEERNYVLFVEFIAYLSLIYSAVYLLIEGILQS